MFGLSMKDRVAGILRRGAKAAMTGGYLHSSEVAAFGLSDNASAYFYTESQAHLLRLLSFTTGKKITGECNWFTEKFFVDNAMRGIIEGADEIGYPREIALVVLKRVGEIERMTIDERKNGGAKRISAKRIREIDPSANESAICKALDNADEKYIADIIPMYSSL